MSRLASAGLPMTSTPPTSAEPDVGTTRVVSMPTVVVLPAPLGPRSPKISPSYTERSRPSTAVTPPGYTLRKPSVRITASDVVTRPPVRRRLAPPPGGPDGSPVGMHFGDRLG